MQRAIYIKSLVLVTIFFGTSWASYTVLNLITSIFNLKPLWGEEVKYLLSILIALVLVLIINKISRQLYFYAKQLILRISLSDFIIVLVGTIVGLLLAALASVPLAGLPQPWSWMLTLLVTVILIGTAVWSFYLKRGKIFDWFSSIKLINQGVSGSKNALKEEVRVLEESINPMILDTSAVIDGRIGEIIKTGFLFGTLLIPHFILHELQQVADSSNAEKRQRGRNGLKLLQSIKRNHKIKSMMVDIDYPEITDVDHKLIQLAKDVKAKIVTCDYNLNTIAKMQDLTILNVNELAIYLKQQYLPGEYINVKVAQAGKENGQGIGYLSDGTMVVIRDAAKFIGREVQAEVERVLQTAAGRMVFVRYYAPAKLKRAVAQPE